MKYIEDGNPDQVGYPEEQEDWWKYVDADTAYQFHAEQLSYKLASMIKDKVEKDELF